MATRASALQVGDIVFHPLSANEWRVSDARHPKESIDALLGFVAQKGSQFYATRMHHPLEATPLSSLDAVAAFFVREHQDVASPGPRIAGVPQLT